MLSLNHYDLVSREEEVDEQQCEQDEGIADDHAHHERSEEVPQPDPAKPHDHRFCQPTKQHAKTVTVTEPCDSVCCRESKRMERPPEKLPAHPSKENSHNCATEQ